MRDTSQTPNDSRRRLFLRGLRGGILATLILYIGTNLLASPFPPEAIFQLLISPVPGSIQSVVVETFLEYAKYTAFVFSSAIFVLIYGLLGAIGFFLMAKSAKRGYGPAAGIEVVSEKRYDAVAERG